MNDIPDPSTETRLPHVFDTRPTWPVDEPVPRLDTPPDGGPPDYIDDPHTPGAKMDAGKNRLGLVLGDFCRALQAVGRVGTFGANKYTPHGWLSVPDGVERYTDALYRHLLKASEGETTDPESGLSHLSHAAWNMLSIVELTERNREVPE